MLSLGVGEGLCWGPEGAISLLLVKVYEISRSMKENVHRGTSSFLLNSKFFRMLPGVPLFNSLAGSRCSPST